MEIKFTNPVDLFLFISRSNYKIEWGRSSYPFFSCYPETISVTRPWQPHWVSNPYTTLSSVLAGSLSNQLLSQRIYNYVNKSRESGMPSIHVLCLPSKSQLQLRRHETESMSTGHWDKNKELSLSPGLYQNIYKVSGLLGAWIRKAGLWVSLSPILKQHTQKQMRRGQAFQQSTRDLRVQEAKTFLVLRNQSKDESHYSKTNLWLQEG